MTNPNEDRGSNLPLYIVSIILTLAIGGLALHNHLNNSGGYYGAPQYEQSEARPGPFRIPTPAADPEPERKEWREEQDLYAQRQMAQWAFWMLVVSSAGVVVGALGLWFLRETLKTALLSNNLFSSASHSQLRAYVTLKSITMRPFNDGRWHVQPIIQNSGQTPAKNMLTAFGWRIEAGEIEDEFDYPNTLPPGRVFAGGGQEVTLSGPIIYPKQLESIRRDNLKLFVWGWVEYNDVFGSTQRHRTEFCQLFLLIRDIDGEHWAWQGRGPHNGIDEECLKRPHT